MKAVDVEMKQNHKAFTLIELLVVIAIIGILAAITVISVGEVRNKATDTRFLADLRSVAGIMEQYASNNNGKYAINIVFATSAPLRWTALQISLQAAAGGSVLPTTSALPTSGDTTNPYQIGHCEGAVLKAGLRAGETSYVLEVTSKNVTTNYVACKTGAKCSSAAVIATICP